jgi:hypothetical protein
MDRTRHSDPAAKITEFDSAASFENLEQARSFFERLVRVEGYYVKYDVDVTGKSGTIYRVHVLSESPKDRILGFRVGTEISVKTSEVVEQVARRQLREQDAAPALKKDEESLREKGLEKVIQVMALAYDVQAKVVLLVKKDDLGNTAMSLATQNGILLLRDD